MFVEEKCRTCLKTATILDSARFTVLHKKMLTKFIPKMNITNTDRICNECANNLESSYRFVTQCEEAQNQFQPNNKKKVFNIKDFLNVFEEDEQADDLKYKNTAGTTEPPSDSLEDGIDSDPPKTVLSAEKLKYRLDLIRHSFPDLDIIIPSPTDHDYNCESNFKVIANTSTRAHFIFKKHLDRIVSLPMVKDVPLSDTQFDLSSSGSKKKRVLLLGTNLNGIMTCNDCNREFKMEQTLAAHKRACLGDILKCNICGRTFFRKYHLKVHKLRYHKKPSDCPLCETQFNTKEERKAHVQKCAYGLECCGQKFNSKQAYYTHNSQHRSNGDNYLCHVCGKSFKRSTALKMHKMIHTGPQLCTVCKKILPNQLAHQNHMARHRRKFTSFMCEQCGKVFNSKAKLSYHVETHNENRTRTHTCKVCGGKFFNKRYLDKHCYMQHSYREKPYSCNVCDRGFSTKEFMERHQQRHGGDCGNLSRGELTEKKYDAVTKQYKYVHKFEICQCEICKKQFTSKMKLRLHVKTHYIRNRPFKCSHCDLRFIYKLNRSRHELVHSKNELRCRICYIRTYDNEEELQAHENSHPKKYKCLLCEEMFARRYLLENHIASTHKENMDVMQNKLTAQLTLPEEYVEYQEDSMVYQEDGEEYEEDRIEYQEDGIEYQNDRIVYQENSTEYQEEGIEYQEDIIQFQKDRLVYQEDDTEYQNDRIVYQENSTEYQEDGIEYQEDGIEYQEDGIEYQEDGIEYQTDRIVYQEESTEHQADGIEYPEDSIKYQEDSIEYQQNGTISQVIFLDLENELAQTF